MFSLSKELSLSDDQATTFVFWQVCLGANVQAIAFELFLYLQAVDEVNRGHIRADERLYQLKALQDSSKKHKVYTKVVKNSVPLV
jgi:hypothetical protein